MSNLQTYYHFILDFQKMDQHTEGKWLIHGNKHRKDNQLQSLELPLIIQIWISFIGAFLCFERGIISKVYQRV